ncbi:glutathione S-transferase family protein [Caldimonas caldifontis]|uniref:Glutathione S-transferase family protein n=1 Tax=Caldimonas caldifontis TaxID=1452508 RepID=A0A2S5SX94_9BURK|nr:glutathione S-transferase family protein [Caldimonas caldifontis]PPE67380.1 glutathione S-transferase family protein [Caldimonas caldifontis]
MTLTIYGIAASRAIRPLWAAEELDLTYRHIKLHHAAPETKAPDYLRLNPNGTVPALEDDGLVLFESLAITLYLARTYGPSRLWPDDAADQARVLQWTLWAATEAEPPARQWFHHTAFLPPAERQPALAAAALQALGRRLAVLERHFADGRPHLLGDDFTVADLNLAAVLQRLKDLGGGDHPRLSAWHARCLARPAAQRAFALRQAG